MLLGNSLLKHGVSTPASITATSGTPQSANCGAAYAVPLVATVKNAAGVGLAGVSVTFTAPGSGASGTFASNGLAAETVVTNAAGQATSSAFTANATGSGGVAYTVAASVGALSVNFSMTNVSYQDLILSTFTTAHLPAYLPLTETSGNALDVSGHSQTGILTGGITWAALAGPGASMGLAPLFNGTNSYFAFPHNWAGFPKNTGAVSFWWRMSAGAWADGVARNLLNVIKDGNNWLYFIKSATVNTYAYRRWGGGNFTNMHPTVRSNYSWVNTILTWDTTAGANGEFWAYEDGIAVTADIGNPATNIGTWVGNPVDNYFGVVVPGYWAGYAAHLVYIDHVPTPAERAILATAF